MLNTTADALAEVDVRTRRLTGDDVTDTIVAETAEYDLTVLGATRESLLDQLVLGTVLEEVGRRAESTVSMAKRNFKPRSRLTRWLRGYSE